MHSYCAWMLPIIPCRHQFSRIPFEIAAPGRLNSVKRHRDVLVELRAMICGAARECHRLLSLGTPSGFFAVFMNKGGIALMRTAFLTRPLPCLAT